VREAPHGGSVRTVAVVVPTYRRYDDLERCLRGLAAQTRLPDDVVVVWNGGDPRSREVALSLTESLPVRCVRVDGSGVVAALNAGLAAASADVICFTDDDTRARSDWIERILIWFSGSPRVGAVGGRDIVHENGSVLDLKAKRVGRFRWFGRYTGNHHACSRAQRVQFLKGANMAFRREALPRFDSRLWGRGAQVWNDLQVSLAVWRAGWGVVWDPNVAVDHFPARRFDDDQRRRRSRAAVIAHHHNEAYIILRELPVHRKLVVLAYALFVGTRSAPGLAQLMLHLVSAPSRRLLAQYRAVTTGRLLGMRTYWRAVRDDDAGPSRPM
jgi:GT2 family glycosyltransferase